MKQSIRNTLLAVLTFSCIVAALRGSGLAIPSGTWQQTGNLSAQRTGASAALLQDGRVLVTGGTGASGAVLSADFFNPDGTVSPAPPMFNARTGHVSVTLQDGRVLVAGGVSAGGSATSTAEIFDPVANSWTFIGTGMTEARSCATAALLQDGRVLIAGGQNGSLISSTIEIFDPSIGAFTYAGMMSSPRTQHSMTVLHDGRVLIVGGYNGTTPVSSTDIFDPTSNTISAGPGLSVARFGHSATTLLNGVVAVIGGNNGNTDPAQADVTPAEIFDPGAATPAFTTITANLTTPREGHLAIALPNNNGVLVVGGTSAGAAVASAELFTPQVSSAGAWTYSFAPAGTMSTARSAAAGAPNQVNAPSTTMQRNGIVAIAGGNDANGNALNTTEAYGYATVQTDQSDYAPGTTVTITGSGFQPGETVNLQLVESPLIDTHGPYSITADANGNFADQSFVTDSHDVNVRFYLMATGGTSGFVAQNAFTDANPNKLTITTSQAPNPVPAGASATYGLTETFAGNNSTSCTVDLSAAPTASPSWPGSGVSFSFNPSSLTSSGADQLSTLTITTPPAMAANTYNFTVTSTPRAGTCQANPKTLTVNGTLVVEAPLPTTLTVSPTSGTYGTTVNLSASLTKTSGGAAVSGQTIDFTLNGNNVGNATTDASGVATLNNISLSGINAGTYTGGVAASFAAANGFASSNGAANLTVNKATATVTVTPYTVTYDGQAHTASYTIIGVNSETGATVGTVTLNSTHTAAGTYASDSYSFTPTANYSSTLSAASSATPFTDTINKATATVTVTPYTVTYDGQAHTAVVTSITGVNGEMGATVGSVDVSNTTHTGAGTYATDSWTFTGTANYNNIAATTITDTINKANAVVVVTPYSVTYDGNAHTATGTATGVKGEALSGLDLSGTTHTAARTYATDPWTFTDSTGNYNNANGTVGDSIAKANAVISVTPYNVTYDGNAHTATGTATGVKGESLAGLSLTGTTHTMAGTFATDPWTFTDSTGNYNNANGTVGDSIAKANAIISVTPYNVTYDGNAHTATGTATGVKGEALSGLDLSGTTHTAARTYATDPWTFTDSTGNYNNANGTVGDSIAKANAVISVTPYNVTYDGNAHTATGTATGVKGESLAGLSLTGTTHTAIGDYQSDPWTFTDATGNYNNANGTVHDNIGYGFVGLESPYAMPPTTFNVQRTMPLVWQYTNASGVVINSANANPLVTISGPYTCGQTDSASDITVSSAGASGYQYDSTTNTWQFNWQIKGNAPGCYNIYIKSQQSNQMNGAFPISVISH